MDKIAGNANVLNFGEVAFAVTGHILPLRVCRSAAGFYIGTISSDSDDSFPMSRESVEYYRTVEEADLALFKGTWTQKEVTII